MKYIPVGAIIVASFVWIGLSYWNAKPTETDEPVVTPPTVVLSTTSAATLATLQQHEWRLVSITDAAGNVPLSGITPRVSFAAGQITTTLCNTIIAPYRAVDDPLEIRIILAQRSRILCGEVEMRPEEALMASMRKGFVVTASPNNQTITLTGRETQFRFTLSEDRMISTTTSTVE